MARIAQTVGTGIAALGLLLGTAAAAHADEQSYMDYLFAHGWNYRFGISAPSHAIGLGHMICDNIHWNGGPLNGFNGFTQSIVDGTMIEGAQHELCPDTLPH
ncbi:DUF732 domain-containing protein [Mycolicibacter arupensis]|jgi:hypothetical protein|uniref:DUF732 domain-containing protein n=1 Tax=Mycolicibacter arupensis TaxID=342002 RepID=A0A5C7Y7B7_9MYCO|nr:DUF732 domain-containing protein [Mycolicibacter arupensis]MCV7274789.1 DUF732 domain-containing protein [Mycolicibacter arupensis]ORA00167.1 hypothetical protein BST15_05595 [Mycolicibacter arupensis]TXI57348.1 MAG: DUF732 domain-containing protein [Mycolicibacter arupensis]